MKVAILTQPLGHNYGGILQAYALEQYIISMGHEPMIFNLMYPKEKFSFSAIKNKGFLYLRKFVRKFIKKDSPQRIWRSIPNKNDELIIYKEFYKFAKDRLKYVDCCNQTELEAKIAEFKPELAIVGSDQVWRPKFSPRILTYYFDFISSSNIKKISYAASFGVSEWEYDNETTEVVKELASKFDGISVREDSAIELCNKHLGVKAQLVLDPTFLVDKSLYSESLTDHIEMSGNYIFSYFLTPDSFKKSSLDHLAKTKRLKVVSGLATSFDHRKEFNNYDDCICMGPLDWVNSIKNAKYILTDSFHGAVFSIIFNKPFILFGNNSRGNTRLQSLLTIVGLEDRFVNKIEDIDTKLVDIDYCKVNKKLQDLKEMSVSYLDKYLKE